MLSSITGGYVYHGNDIPELDDHYIFGDFVTGRIFALDTNNVSPACGTPALTLDVPSISVSTFGLVSGDVFVADYSAGFLYKFSPDPSPTLPPSPTSVTPSISQGVSESPTRTPSASKSQSAQAIPPPPSVYANLVSSNNNGRTVEIEVSYQNFC